MYRLRSQVAGLAGFAVLVTGADLASAQSSGITEFTLNNSTQTNAITPDGTIVVGGSRDSLNTFYGFTIRNGVFQTLGNVGNTVATAVTPDGSVIVGASAFQAFRSVNGGPLQSLGLLPGGFSSAALGVSADGSVIVGRADDANFAQQAFRWTQATGLQSLGFLNGGSSSGASGISADGTIIVGTANDGANGDTPRAFRWTQATGIQSLGILNGGDFSNAAAISADGKVIVGFASDGAAGNIATAVRSVNSGPLQSLGLLNGGNFSTAFATNTDGSVIVGRAANGAAGNTPRAFRWTQAGGIISVDQWLRNNGANLPSDVTSTASGVSADGNVIVGTLANGHGFIARLSGLLDLTSFYASLANLPRVGGQLQSADLAVNGAHSSPLYSLLAYGQSSVSTTGDAAVSNSSAFNSTLGLGDLGIGYGVAPGVTLRASFGGLYSKQDLASGGDGKLTATYVAPQVTVELGRNVFATASGYASWGSFDLRRGYSNGVVTDYSAGSAATRTAGVRARLDWKDAAKVAATAISPYVSFTHLASRIDGYTETGGGFPVSFNATTEIARTARVGADTLTPIAENFGLVARLEYAHRFEATGAGITGQMVGLSAFDIAGAAIRQDWARGGLGLRYGFGWSDGLIMVNASNQSGGMTTWLSASYRMVF